MVRFSAAAMDSVGSSEYRDRSRSSSDVVQILLTFLPTFNVVPFSLFT